MAKTFTCFNGQLYLKSALKGKEGIKFRQRVNVASQLQMALSAKKTK